MNSILESSGLIDPMMGDPPPDHVVKMRLTLDIVWEDVLWDDVLRRGIQVKGEAAEHLKRTVHGYALMLRSVSVVTCARNEGETSLDRVYDCEARTGLFAIFASANDALMFRLAIA